MEKLEIAAEKEKAKELRRWYSNWDMAVPALYIDMLHSRKDIEYEKWLKRHSNKM